MSKFYSRAQIIRAVFASPPVRDAIRGAETERGRVEARLVTRDFLMAVLPDRVDGRALTIDFWSAVIGEAREAALSGAEIGDDPHLDDSRLTKWGGKVH